MTKKDLISKLREDKSLTKAQAQMMVDGVIDALADALKTEDRVAIPGLGVFKAKIKPARTLRRPYDGQMIDVPERRVVTFKATKALS